jgi:hypothetical protein
LNLTYNGLGCILGDFERPLGDFFPINIWSPCSATTIQRAHAETFFPQNRSRTLDNNFFMI